MEYDEGKAKAFSTQIKGKNGGTQKIVVAFVPLKQFTLGSPV